MPAVLGDKYLRRLVKVYGVEGDIIAAINRDGITLKAPSTKLGVQITWPQLVEACTMPSNVPSKFQGRPYEFLKSQALEHQKRMTKKLAEKIEQERKERQ